MRREKERDLGVSRRGRLDFFFLLLLQKDSHILIVFEMLFFFFLNIPSIEQRSAGRKEEENNRPGGDVERDGGMGRMVGDAACRCCCGFNYRQRNTLFKYLEHS